MSVPQLVFLPRAVIAGHDNPAAETAAICKTFGYEAFIVQRGEKIAALPGFNVALGFAAHI